MSLAPSGEIKHQRRLHFRNQALAIIYPGKTQGPASPIFPPLVLQKSTPFRQSANHHRLATGHPDARQAIPPGRAGGNGL